jgi:FKBP-type peptidyl-prolyl cis-trans isomerase
MRLFGVLVPTMSPPAGFNTRPSTRPTTSLDPDSVHIAGTPSRRQMLSQLGLLPVLTAGPALSIPAGDWSSPGLASPEDETAPKFFRTESGVKVQELMEGSGPKTHSGDRVLIDFVLRRSNGYFIYGTVEGVGFQPTDIPTGPVVLALDKKSTIPGLVDGMQGIRPGGKRRILIPPSQGYSAGVGQMPEMPTFATSRQLSNHKNEPLLFEVQLLRII